MTAQSPDKEGTSQKAASLVSGTRNITIWIDMYEDLFSDFDPRPLSERNISDDFLYELKKISRESQMPFVEFKLLIPEKARKPEQEKIITGRLHAYFKGSQHLLIRQINRKNRKGILFTLLGMILMVGASYVSFLQTEGLARHILLVIFEPAGWFLVWSGLDSLFYGSHEKRSELNFYRKMARTRIAFVGI